MAGIFDGFSLVSKCLFYSGHWFGGFVGICAPEQSAPDGIGYRMVCGHGWSGLAFADRLWFWRRGTDLHSVSVSSGTTNAICLGGRNVVAGHQPFGMACFVGLLADLTISWKKRQWPLAMVLLCGLSTAFVVAVASWKSFVNAQHGYKCSM